MSGTKQGGLLAAETNRTLYGSAFYKEIGSRGGKAPKTKPGGFATMSPERLREVSAKGGSRSTRKKTVNVVSQPEYSTEISTQVFFSKSAKVRAFLRTITGRA